MKDIEFRQDSEIRDSKTMQEQDFENRDSKKTQDYHNLQANPRHSTILSQPFIIQTHRMIIRKLTMKDFTALLDILQDKETMWAWCEDFSNACVRKWIIREQKNYQKFGCGWWAIVLKSTDNPDTLVNQSKDSRIIGLVGLHFNKHAELSYILKKEFWGQGLGREAAEACKEYAFRIYGMEELYCICREDNHASQALAQALGGIKNNEETNNEGETYYHFRINANNPTSFLLQTNHLLLRRYTLEDLPALHTILSDKETMYAWGHGFSIDESKEWLEEQLKNYKENGFGIWAIIDKASGTIIGNAGLDRASINLTNQKSIAKQEVVEIGYIVAKRFWGQGLGTEVARAVQEYAFKVLGLERLYCLIKEDNFASMRVARKLGGRIIGEIIKNYKGKDLMHYIFECKGAELVFESENTESSYVINKPTNKGFAYRESLGNKE